VQVISRAERLDPNNGMGGLNRQLTLEVRPVSRQIAAAAFGLPPPPPPAQPESD
jgi:hypothetical protein